MTSIFISYRRKHARRDARAIYERLARDLGHEHVFMDLQGLSYGVDYVLAIEMRLQQCKAMLVLIDPQWLDDRDEQGRRRLEDPNDFVRLEVRTALMRDIPVVPVLLDGARLPTAAELPVDLQPLARRHKFDLNFEGFEGDIRRLLAVLPVERNKRPDAAEAAVAAGRSSASQANVILPAPRRRSVWALAAALVGLLGLLNQELLAAWSAGPTSRWLAGLWPQRQVGLEIVTAPTGAGPGPARMVGERFRDCESDACPWLIALPAGRYLMGSPDTEPQRDVDEGPQHPVELGAFGIGQFEVTFEQWDACTADGGCPHRPADEGWGRGKRPVMNVNWQEAQGYAVWLSAKTGQTYRLPSEAEWEYAARAGTISAFAFGAQISTTQANFNGNETYNGSHKGEYRAKTLPVGSLSANLWQVQDMHGNVWEWVADCWHPGYEGAPSDGSAWAGDCASDRYVLRGGAWDFGPTAARSAYRSRFPPDFRDEFMGFRLVRSLPP